jgi:hypothetical protein
MTANDDDTIEPNVEIADTGSVESEAKADAPVSTGGGSTPPSLPRAEPLFGKLERTGPAKDKPEPAREAPELVLMPWPQGPDAEAASAAAAKPRRSWRPDPLGVAASLAAVGFVAVSLFAAYDHVRGRALIAGKAQEAQELQKSVTALKTRIDALEVARSQEQTAELKKTLSEIKSAATAAQGAQGALAQLAQRVDKIDKEQNTRLDKLGEKVDQASANRFAEIVARLEKLEKRPMTVALAQPAPPPKPLPLPPAAPAAKPSPIPAVSNDVTGSIERPKPVLRGFTLDDVRGGVAYIESRDGPFTVSAGDTLPGAGKVLRIERRGLNYVVVTSQGLITTPEEPY